MAGEQLAGEVLQPHIKEPINPRPQLPQMPQCSTHTHTDQNRADRGHAALLSLSASWGFFELTQMVCCNAVLSFHFVFIVPTKM